MIDRTVDVWSPMVGRELSREEAHDILVDISIFLRYLLRWDQVARKASDTTEDERARAA